MIVASLAGPVGAEDNTDAAVEAPDSSDPATGDASAGNDSECADLKAQIQEKIEAYVQEQKAAYASLAEQQAADHEAFHEANHSDADHKAFHEGQEQTTLAYHQEQAAAVQQWTADAWQAYREHCDATSGGEKNAPSGVPEECRAKWAEYQSLMEEMRRKWETRHRQFQAEFDAARADYRDGNHTDSEWKAFDEKWSSRARALRAEMETDMKAVAEKPGMGDCRSAYAHDGEPVPAYREKQGELKMDEGARQIMERCQSRMKQLMQEGATYRRDADYQVYRDGSNDPYPSEPKPDYPADGSEPRPAMGDATRPSGDSGRMQERMKDLRAQCEAEMKAYMKQKHDEKQGDFGSFVMHEEDGQILVEGRFLSLVGLPERQMMTEIALDGKVLIDALYANGFLAEFRPEQNPEGSTIAVFDEAGNQILSVHDNPRAVIKMATSDAIAQITLDLNDDLAMTEDDEGLRFEYGEWKGAVLVHKGEYELADGNVLTLTGKATFLVTNGAHERLGDAYDDAILHKKVGAEVSVSKDGDADTADLGEMEVTDTKLEGTKLTALIDSADGEGKTVVFKVESGLFECTGLSVNVYAVNEDGSESTLEIREASSLEDVLDPTDDGPDGFEYWCVSDKDGQQILVSFAHFSQKRIEIQSALGNALVPGFEASLLAAAAGVGLLLVGVRRRKA